MDHRDRKNDDSLPILVGSIDSSNNIGNISPNCKNVIRANKSMSSRKKINEKDTTSSFWNILSNCGNLKDVMFDNCLEETKLEGNLNNNTLNSYKFRRESRNRLLPGSSRRSVLDGDTGIFVVTNSKGPQNIRRQSNFELDHKLECPSKNLLLPAVGNSEKTHATALFCEKSLHTFNEYDVNTGLHRKYPTSTSTCTKERMIVEKNFQNSKESGFALNAKSSENNRSPDSLGEHREQQLSLPEKTFDNEASLVESEETGSSDNSISNIEESKSYQESFIESGIFEQQLIAAALHEAELEEEIRLEDSGRYHCADLFVTQVPLSLWTVRNSTAVMEDKTEEFSQKRSDGARIPFFVNPFSNEHTERMKQSIGNLLPTKKYTLPDKNVASQVLMYRQLLHTECKPGLRLSRAYQGTDAQKAVKHMPWWEQGVETSKKMVISYDNLVVRLWLNGVIMPYAKGGYAAEHQETNKPKDNEETEDCGSEDKQSSQSSETRKNESGTDGKSETKITEEIPAEDEAGTKSEKVSVETFINDQGLPPIPHDYWVDRLGFQQRDPVTDFRSGGVLSLAMLVHIVESCPSLHARFLPNGDVNMLPFGITCINITDMIAKFCMFSKSVDRMDALLSQKPFWRMFGDPNALLSLQEISMEILCNVVVQIGRERKNNCLDRNEVKESLHGEHEGKVTVFDFSEILSRTEKRVRDELLASGPKTVDELRYIAARLRFKYERDISRREEKVRSTTERKSSLLHDDDTKYSAGKKSILTKNDCDCTLGQSGITGTRKKVTENILGTATNILSKIRLNDNDPRNHVESTTEEKEIEPETQPKEISSNNTLDDSHSKPAAISDNIRTVTGSILGTANNILNIIRQNDNEANQGNDLSNKYPSSKQIESPTIEEVSFASQQNDQSTVIPSKAGGEIIAGTAKAQSNTPITIENVITDIIVQEGKPKETSTLTIDDEIGML